MEKMIQADLMSAMKERDAVRTNTLRAIKTEITKLKTAEGFSGTLTNNDIIKAMQKIVKTREEAATIYHNNGRDDLFANEIAEADIIKTYLPKELDDSEIKEAVETIINDLGASSMKDMGKVMGEIKKRYGATIDGGKASAIVKNKLG